MANERDGYQYDKGTEKQPYSQSDQQSSPFDDLEAGADDVEKVKGGLRHRGDPCDGGE